MTIFPPIFLLFFLLHSSVLISSVFVHISLSWYLLWCLCIGCVCAPTSFDYFFYFQYAKNAALNTTSHKHTPKKRCCIMKYWLRWCHWTKIIVDVFTQETSASSHLSHHFVTIHTLTYTHIMSIMLCCTIAKLNGFVAKHRATSQNESTEDYLE